MKPYQPSNKVASGAFKWLLLSSVIGGLAIGGITFAVSRLVYLVLVFPALMGLAGGMVSANAVRGGKVRNPLIASAFAALTGLIVYGTVQAGEYLSFKQEASREISKEFGQVDRAIADKMIDAYLNQETGATGFWGFMKYSAKQGVKIGKFGTEGAQLDETFTWVYWLIELAIIDGIAIALAYFAAQQPFCESCNGWYGEKERVGNVEGLSSENFLDLVKKENFIQAGQLINPAKDIPVPSLEVHLQNCPTCKISGSMLTVSQASLNSKGNLEFKESLQGMISPSQKSYLLKNAKSETQAEPENS
ncbi:hypothetical protein [Aerosakkonema funiforme]|uniref:Uncharacterized protein n=2 Tax=Oscillatoriophycideae TaxID=1301283 RepID=A0A926ZI96_9CYAN|nr:hypothetical protein [Aerosakkonema funiforme]MBD2184193.1 hypothetical protein [Aerosakkonema funiforme FACHB-1375]